jgi:DnaJ-class molecular chaperone
MRGGEPTNQPDLYARLGVERTASRDQITAAYRRRVRELHPDAHQDSDGDAAALILVIEAYEVLSDAGRRRRYDETRSPAVRTAIPVRRGNAGVRTRRCTTCGGRGAIATRCPACHGRGYVLSPSAWLRTPWRCSICAGAGGVLGRCRACGGTGRAGGAR